MSAFSRRNPHPLPPARRPRWWSVATVAAALLLVSLPSSAQAPVPPEGALVIVVGLSDGLTVIPVSSGVVPVTCEVAP